MGATTTVGTTDVGSELFATRDAGRRTGESGTNGHSGQTTGNGPRIHRFGANPDSNGDTGNTTDPGNSTDNDRPAKTPRTRRGHGSQTDALGELIAEGLGAINSVLEVARGPHWRIPDAKMKRVGVAYAKVIDAYFPASKIGESSIILGAMIATLSAYGPAVTVDTVKVMEAAAKMRQAQAAARAARPQPPPFNPAGMGYMPPQQPSYQSDPFYTAPTPPPVAENPQGMPVSGDVVTQPPNDMFAAMGIDVNDPQVQAAMQTANAILGGMFGENGGA